jgi:hypothetical protein
MRQRGIFLIFFNAMILIVLFALMTQSLVIIQRIASADKVSGHVWVQRGGDGAFAALTLGAPVKTSDVIRTDADGTAEFKWMDGTRWKVMPKSEITVKKSTFNTLKKAEQNELRLTTGKVFIRIMKALAPASRFEVETPTAVAAVRGTIFSVEVVDGKTKVDVFRGHVKVSSLGEGSTGEKMIEPGQEAVSSGSDALQAVAATNADAEFKAQASIVQPELQADVKALADGKALVRGNTEKGNTLTINGQSVRILGNGTFLQRVTLQPGNNTFTIISTDRHGGTTTVTRTIALPGTAALSSVSNTAHCAPPAASPPAAAQPAIPEAGA